MRCFICILCSTQLLVGALVGAQEPATTVPATGPQNVDAAIARGLSFLARQQNPDGSFDAGAPRITATGLSLLAFLSAGHVSDVGRYGLNVRNAVDFLVKLNPADGYFGKVDGAGMRGHAIVMLALAEAHGVESEAARRKIQPILAAGVKAILAAQDVEKPPPLAGGWGDEAESADSHLPATAWCALALRAAQNVGLNVPKPPVERGVTFVLNCYNAETGRFAEKPGGQVTAAAQGSGVLSLFLLDAGDRAEVVTAATHLAEGLSTADSPPVYPQLFFTTQAAHQAGGATWTAVWDATRHRLLTAQETDGGWPAPAEISPDGRMAATALSVLSLTVSYRLLPIYQR